MRFIDTKGPATVPVRIVVVYVDAATGKEEVGWEIISQVPRAQVWQLRIAQNAQPG